MRIPSALPAMLGLCCLAVARFVACGAEAPPRPVFYLPFDGAVEAALAGGPTRRPQRSSGLDSIPALADRAPGRFTPGIVGQAFRIADGPLLFSCAGNFRPDEGTVSFWINPDFRGDDTNIYCTFFGAADWGMLYKYLKHTGMTFGTRRPPEETGDLYYDCTAPGLKSWRPGEWHHVAATWSRKADRRCVFIDGRLGASAPFPYHRPVSSGPLFVGGGCTLYPAYAAHGQMDEFAIWDRALDAAQIARIVEMGRKHTALVPPAAFPALRPEAASGAGLATAGSRTPALRLPDSVRPVASSPTRESLSLDGNWSFLPASGELDALPETGWGTTAVPGYWTRAGTARAPDGKPARKGWGGAPWTDFPVAYCRRAFLPPATWRGKRVFLEIGGVDGLGEAYLNGRRIGLIPQWEPVLMEVSREIRFGVENRLTLLVSRRGSAPNTGVYGHVSLELRPRAFVYDWAVRPEFAPDGKKTVTFSCRVWAADRIPNARVVFDVRADSAPERTVQTFERRTALEQADRRAVEVYDAARPLVCRFVWEGARPWTFDDPFMYRVRATVYDGDHPVDVSPFVRFGFREFRIRGGDLLLNGVPTHLRGHQVDMAWPKQYENLVEFEKTGANCIELSAPIRANWYAGTPWNEGLFERILNYADRHGVITIPALPDARVLRTALFRPEVARRYRRRLDKHIRRYGNHPSVCLWFMSFNLAGYRWMHLQSALDGSYKPEDPVWRKKERYSLAAQRIAQELDPRPIYHHSCGNFGDIYTLNCYIGPSCPLQEREEWPSAWAAKRPFPLIACEHGLLLVPYWFRPRQFPLGKVYAGEPIFDELSAKYLGPRAYRSITPALFDLYDLERDRPRSGRTRALIAHHPGYQEVKALFARRSLRAWRIWGVSGIIFNAIKWDFDDDRGRALPVKKALARWFGDTDLVLTGPGDDWPSKDHAFYAGEKVRKQAVLINDLTRSLPVTLRWEFRDERGRIGAGGTAAVSARPGRPTAVPIEFVAPAVSRRGLFRLVVRAVGPNADRFQADALELDVFPRPDSAPERTIGRRVLVYDPVGDTRRLLDKAGIAATPFGADGGLGTGAALVVVGRKAWSDSFAEFAASSRLLDAVRAGRANLLVFEQLPGRPVFGLELAEQSARRVFPLDPGHPLLAGLEPRDFIDLRGAGDLLPARPPPAPETEKKWPKRYFKWGNRGITATVVFRKPHFGPFRPVLECGFDLTDAPLLEARIGRGRIVLCNVDVTPRYGVDPVSTRLITNLIFALATSPASSTTAPGAACVEAAGDSAARLLERFGLVQSAGVNPDRTAVRSILVVGGDAPDPGRILDRVRAGAVALLLPGVAVRAADAFGLRTSQQRYFTARKTGADPLTTGVSASDLYLKKWMTGPVLLGENGWRLVLDPGLLAVRKTGKGRLIACTFPIPEGAAEKSHAGVKAVRFWNRLLANIGLSGPRFSPKLRPLRSPYVQNPWEQLPPYINW
ncbi:MAG: hypothetical protein GXP31_06420 [Kiritimatiellaeota bacterium]|nr:hypothetical protein [Kiritimatiellota bacterium]